MLNRLNLLNKFFYYPPDAVAGGGAPDTKMSKEDVIQFLGEDDEPEDKPIDLKDRIEKAIKGKEKPEEDELETSDDTSEDDEDLELKDLDEELEGPSEEQLELITPVRRADILKYDPNLFKKFPYLEKAYYREQQFTEIYPTIDDAREAASAKETLDHFENDLLSGNTEKILSSVKTSDPKAFNKLVDGYLPTLAKVDSQAYHHVISNIMSHTIHEMVKESRTSKDEALEAAAQILNRFIYGKSEYVNPTNLSKEEDDRPDERTSELEKREQAIQERDFTRAKDDLNTRVNNMIKATIDGNIDLKDSMSPYIKKNASREAMEQITELIEKDSRFRTILDRLWEAATRNGYDKTSTDRIRNACVTKAKTLLPSVIKKARIEALKGMGKRVKDDEVDDVEEKQTTRTGPIKTKGKDTTQTKGGQRVNGGARPIRKGESTAEYLMSDD